MIATYAGEERGVEIRAVAGGFKFYTKPQHHEVVRRFIKSLRPPLRLTMPALETLAVIAYRQPVTGPEIQEIRGVNVSGVIKTLLEKRLIVTAGRKAVMGRPDHVPLIEGILDALWPLRSRRAAEPEGIRATRPRGPWCGRRHRSGRTRADGNHGGRGRRDRQRFPVAATAAATEPQETQEPQEPQETIQPRQPPSLKRNPSSTPRRKALPRKLMQERLQKIIARAGIASRRHAEDLIRSGQVRVNGVVVTELGAKADPEHDRVEAAGRVAQTPETRVYLLLNKPTEVVSTLADPEGRRTLRNFLVGVSERVFPVGRLDYAASGAVFLTNDGELASRMLKASPPCRRRIGLR